MTNQYTVAKVHQGFVEGIKHDFNDLHTVGYTKCLGLHNIVGEPAIVYSKEEEYARFKIGETIYQKVNSYIK